LYLLVDYPAQQFQLAPVVSDNDLSSDLRVIGSSSSGKCPAGPSVTVGDIGAIVVGSILAIFFIVVLLFWVIKLRPVWNEMKEKTSNVAPLKEDIKDLEERVEGIEAIDRSGGRPIELQEMNGTQRPPDTSELPSPNSRERPRFPSIPATGED